MPCPNPDNKDRGDTVIMTLSIVAALLVVTVAIGITSVALQTGAETPVQEQEEQQLTVNDLPVKEALTVTEARTDGPIYDLPGKVSQQIVCDCYNREYLLLTTDQGGICLIPYLDETGEQAIMPRA